MMLAAGCALNVSGPDGGTALATDRASYTATYERGTGSYSEYGFTIVARFTNTGRNPVYLGRCYPTSPQPIFGVTLVGEDATHRSAFNGTWACVGHSQQFLIAPGDVRVDTLHISGPNGFNGITGQPYGTLSGRMRLSYEVAACPGDGGCTPAAPERAYSNEFEVTQLP